MTPEQHQRVKTLFMSACELSPAERRALLDKECTDDAAVRAEVEGLLGHDSDPHESLKTPALGIAMTTVLGKALAPPKPTEMPERIGPFRIVRILGLGGMGVVYLAEQDRPRRTVALKVMQAGPGAVSLLRRFEHEADLLGRLRHPGIAQIFESGLAGEGPLARPYIAMEYVDGRPLTEAAIKRSLSIRQRVELMVRVCEAVQHAHQRGVIHRDLKPANILVDESNQPKVLDFGVARATDADIQLTSMNTGIGQMVGTLPYMSPEQVMGDPREIDTRSDVYALGVILYQLLTGKLPHEPSGRSMPELARMIRDDSPARLSSIDRMLRGDLDTIVGKAMEKEKPRRYQSAAGLGDDLKRFLSGEPISAKADSALYVIGKQLRKHKWPVAAGAVALLALVVFAVYAGIQAQVNRRLADEADVARAAALSRAEEAETARGREQTAREDAERAEARAEAELEFANIQRGRMAVQAGSTPGAEELLWTAFLRDPSSAAARWGLWEFCARFGARAIVQAHAGLARGCTLSPDGRIVYTLGNDGAARAWDATTLEMIAEDRPPTAGGTYTILASPDGSAVVAADSIVGVRVLHPTTMARLATLDMRESWARTVAFSPSGDVMYLGRGDGSLSMYETRTWTLVNRVVGHAAAITTIDVAPAGWPIATSDIRGNIAIWEGPEAPARTWRAHLDDLPSLAFTGDGRYLVSGGNDERSKVWDVSTGEQTGELSAPNGSVRDVDLAPGGRTFLSSGWWAVLTWDAATWTRIATLSMPATVFEIAASPDGKTGYAVLENGTLRSWRIGHGPEALRLTGHSGRTVGEISRDGTRIATGDSDGMLRIWDARDGRLLGEVRAHDTRIRCLAFHPTRPWIATCRDNQFIMWDVETLQPVWPAIAVYSLSHSSFDFSRDGRYLALPGQNWRTYVLDAVTGSEVTSFSTARAEPVSLRFTPDGDRLLVVQRGPRAHVVNSVDGSVVAALDLKGRLVWTGDFSPDGSTLAMGDWDRELSIWNTSDWTLRRTLTGHAGLIYDVRFGPAADGIVATAGAEGTVRLWDAAGGRPLLTLDRFDGWTAHSVSFNPAGDRLLSCNAHNGEVVVWDLRKYDQDIARHVEYEIQRREASMGASMRADEARAWAAGVLGSLEAGRVPIPGAAADVEGEARTGPGLDAGTGALPHNGPEPGSEPGPGGGNAP